MPWAVLERRYAAAVDALVMEIVGCMLDGRPVVVDTINSLYTGEDAEAGMIALASALLRESSLPALATGQVRGSPIVPWGWRWIVPWATHVAVIRRARQGLSVVEFLKPRKALAALKVEPGGGPARWA